MKYCDIIFKKVGDVMPSTVTHSYFIMDIYDKLPLDKKIFLKDQKNNMKAFAQSTDSLNFYISCNLKKSKKIRKFASFFHTHKTGEFLITLTNYIKYNYYKDNPEVMAFLYSMISHYILDSELHPFIYYKTGNFNRKDKTTYKYNSKHHFMETYIDKYLISIREKITPYKYKHYKEIFNYNEFTKELSDVINFSFKETFNTTNFAKEYNLSLKRMKLAFKILRYDPHGFKSKLYNAIDLISPKKTPKISFLSYYYKCKNNNYLNTDHKKWTYPVNKSKKYTLSFTDLYINALSDAIKVIEEVNEYIYNNKKINLEKLFKDNSYTTGISTKKDQTMIYFED